MSPAVDVVQWDIYHPVAAWTISEDLASERRCWTCIPWCSHGNIAAPTHQIRYTRNVVVGKHLHNLPLVSTALYIQLLECAPLTNVIVENKRGTAAAVDWTAVFNLEVQSQFLLSHIGALHAHRHQCAVLEHAAKLRVQFDTVNLRVLVAARCIGRYSGFEHISREWLEPVESECLACKISDEGVVRTGSEIVQW